MPIRRLDRETLEQVCAGCGAVHAIPIKHASIKARKGPYALEPGDTLALVVDEEKRIITFEERLAVRDMQGAALAERLEIAGTQMTLDAEAIRITSRGRGLGRSLIRVVGGTAQEKLGLDDYLHRPLCVGVSKGRGDSRRTAADTIALPHCPECGSVESLVRTWDRCPSAYAQSFLSQHRRAVNALATYLEAEGFALQAAQAKSAARATPPDIDPRYPAEPLVLSVPAA
jgi:hypothetical protein